MLTPEEESGNFDPGIYEEIFTPSFSSSEKSVSVKAFDDENLAIDDRCNAMKPIDFYLSTTIDDNPRPLREALYYGGDPDTRTLQGKTLLMMACDRGNINTAKLLLANGAKIRATDNGAGFAPIHYAVVSNHPNIVELLIDNKCSPDLVTRFGMTPLMLASAAGRCEMIRLLVRRGAVEINNQHTSGKTALHMAAENKKIDAIRTLLALGAGPSRTIKDKNLKIPMDYVDETRDTEELQELLRPPVIPPKPSYISQFVGMFSRK
jgi:ankyrin repeat protein